MPAFAIIESNMQGEVVEETIRTLIKRHESLRTSFHLVEDEPVQKIHHLEELIKNFCVELCASPRETNDKSNENRHRGHRGHREYPYSPRWN
jgi:hypothetical protein